MEVQSLMCSKTQSIQDTLRSEMGEMPIIDAHEHLPTEEELVSTHADLFTRIYCHYSITNAISAGMNTDREVLSDASVPLDDRWKIFKLHLDSIKDTGYAQAAQIAARDLYGIEQINDDTYEILSDRLKSANKPGLYKSILRDKCRIETILNQASWREGREGYARGLCFDLFELDFLTSESFRRLHEKWTDLYGGPFESLRAWADFWVSRIDAGGYVGLKFAAHVPAERVDDAEAESMFRRFRSASINDGQAAAMGTWMMHRAIESAPAHGFVVAMHCGLLWTCWEDFRRTSPLNIIPIFLRYRETVFDLYHGGIPWIRETGVIGNQYPNVNLNLTWCHQISPFMVEQMLNEWIDIVPISKIIGFGGDGICPEESYGALRLAKENIARVLAVRVSRGQMSESRAVDICRAWLYDNPKKVYNLA